MRFTPLSKWRYMASFEERQKELCLLASFVSEQEQWLNSILGQLKWSKSSLQVESESALVQCPVNEHHYVPATSLETHKKSCCYTARGVGGANIDQSSPLVLHKDTLYNDVHVPSVEIDDRIERAIRIVASDPGLYESKESRDSHVTLSADSVEDTVTSGLDLASLTPHQLISYIKSWKKIPLDWRSVVPGSLNLNQLKGWLFHHLPTEHAHSSSVGGEIVAVDSIIQCLTQVSQTITPNAIMEQLKPLLRANTGPFILNLWKHLHISSVLSERGVSEGVVEDIAPMPLTQLLTLQRGIAPTDQEEIPQAYKKILEVVEGARPAPDETPPLPTDAVFYSSTPTERRVRYDYIVGAWQVKAPKKKKTIDPDLYRNDEAALKAKLKAEAQARVSGEAGGTASIADVLRERKEKRDYKRRRQKYRAKNVHVTRRKTSEIFRDIINNRMEEIVETLTPELTRDSVTEQSNLDRESEAITQFLERPSSSRRDRSSPGAGQESEHRGSSQKKKRSARSRSRSRSRERRHSHKKHKKHKSHKHSSSREH